MKKFRRWYTVQYYLHIPTLRVHCIQKNFFICFEAKLSEYGSYSLHICMFLYIRQHHLFAWYSLQNICTNSHANIHFIILANICFEIFVLKRIFANKYSLSIASNFIGKAFTSLMTQLIFIFLKIFASYCLKIFAWKQITNKYLLRKEYSGSAFIRFACKIRWIASIRNKRIKHVLYASKRIKIRFIFAYIRFEPNIPALPTHSSICSSTDQHVKISLILDIFIKNNNVRDLFC